MVRDMIKTIRNGHAYYIQKRIFEMNVAGEAMSELTMLQLSDIVIDIKNNGIVKCRYALEDMLAGAVEQEFDMDAQTANFGC